VRLSDFDFHLPDQLIAQSPVEPRDSSRLLVVPRDGGELEHRHFRDLDKLLNPGDVLVVNETRVLPARLIGERIPTGAAVELLLLRRIDRDRWETLVKPGRKARPGQRISFGGGALIATVIDTTQVGGRIVEFQYEGIFETLLDQLGQMPLPPYIHEKLVDNERYQTVFAREVGSAAAPTAGLHFTPELLSRLAAKGVVLHKILLHVGLGTFRPVQVDNPLQHQMHSEFYTVAAQTAEALNRARQAGGRIVAVGTTSVRTLETVTSEDGQVQSGQGWTDIFIYPGYRFKGVDLVITNFHLPKSTLIMLVSAFTGRERTLQAYQTAVQEHYRFFSFGDAMLLL